MHEQNLQQTRKRCLESARKALADANKERSGLKLNEDSGVESKRAAQVFRVARVRVVVPQARGSGAEIQGRPALYVDRAWPVRGCECRGARIANSLSRGTELVGHRCSVRRDWCMTCLSLVWPAIAEAARRYSHVRWPPCQIGHDSVVGGTSEGKLALQACGRSSHVQAGRRLTGERPGLAPHPGIPPIALQLAPAACAAIPSLCIMLRAGMLAGAYFSKWRQHAGSD